MTDSSETSILSSLRPARPDSGLSMPGYYIWGSSVVRVGRTWHMFSSRWAQRSPEAAARLSALEVLQNYIDHSEIIRAEADNPEGPYSFREVVLRPRGGGHWDHHCCHNPCVVRAGGGFALFFQTSTQADKWDRRIGCATAGNVAGPWSVCDEAIDLGGGAVNPAVLIEPGGGALMVYRAANMRIAVARAAHFAGPYEVVNADILPGIGLEDPFLYRRGGRYHVIVEDNQGRITARERHGARLVSDDGVCWRVHETEPRAYTHAIEWTDGTSTTVDRRERPSLILEGGRPTHLVTAVLHDGRARSVVQPLGP